MDRQRSSSTTRTTLSLALAAGLLTAPLAAVATAQPSAPAGSTGATTTPAPAALTAPAEISPSVSDGITHDENPRVPEGASWTEHYFPSSDGSDVELHADVLRPAHLPEDEPTPVILSVGPYFAHAGQSNDEGFEHTGPSERFNDLIEGGSLMERGYTVVYVDLRGFGGSTGCLDWGGPGEQADTVAAVEWAAGQPWSNGKVGLYGKSYDGVTGLIGANHGPDGLEAVVAQAPVWDLYNYLWSNGVPRPNITGTPRAYNSIASIQGLPDDTERYRANAAYEQDHPECFENNLNDPQDPDPDGEYWSQRNLAAMAEGSTVPLMITQGILEPNTKPEDMQTYLDNHAGEQKGWIGPWEHIRGNDVDADGNLLTGREGWFEEVMRFYDEHLLDIEPALEDPNFVIQDNLGTWRAQDTWPRVTRATSVDLQDGSYVDDGGESGAGAAAATSGAATYDMENAPRLPEPALRNRAPQAEQRGQGQGAGAQDEAGSTYYTWSRPTSQNVRLTGAQSVSFTASGEGNVLVRLWDVAPDGTAVMFDEQMSLVSSGEVAFDLKDTDWVLEKGHQLAVGIGTNTTRGWRDTPSGERIDVTDAQLHLQLANTRRDEPTHGGRAPWLDTYLSNYTGEMEPQRGTFNLNVPQGHY